MIESSILLEVLRRAIEGKKMRELTKFSFNPLGCALDISGKYKLGLVRG